MDVENEINERIVAAANALYAQSNRVAFPTVDAVRKAARVSMNAANEVMKKWRSLQMAKPEPAVVIQVPQEIADASYAALAILWKNAQDLSNSALCAAQKSWEADRLGADVLSNQMAQAYDVKELELEAAQAEIKELQLRVDQGVTERTQLTTEIDRLRIELLAVKTSAQNDAALVQAQHENQLAQLNATIDAERKRRSEEVTMLRDELAEQNQKSSAERDQLRTEIAQVKAQAQAAEQQYGAQHDSDQERLASAEAQHQEWQKAAATAREEAAELHGQVVAMKTQIADLLKIITLRQLPPGQDSSPGDLLAIAETSQAMGEKQ